METGQKILVVFNDGEKINRKEGTFLLQDDKFLHLRVGKTTHLLPLNLIIRMEASE